MCPTTFEFTHAPCDFLVLFPHIVFFYSFMPCYSMVQLYGFVCHTHTFWFTRTLPPCHSLLQAHLITLLFFVLDMPCDCFDLGSPSNKSLLLSSSKHTLFGYVILCFRFTLLFFQGFWGFVGSHT